MELKGNLRIEEKTVGSVYIYDNDGFIAEGICKRKVEEIVDKVNNSIQLKNLDLTGINMKDQNYKISEEEQEFIDSFNDYLTYHTICNRNHLIEELWDTFQAKLGLLEKVGIAAEEVQAYYYIWIKKLENRPREKKCSKCINCELIHYTSIDDVLFCNQGQFTTQEYIAKNCKCYEEQEE